MVGPSDPGMLILRTGSLVNCCADVNYGTGELVSLLFHLKAYFRLALELDWVIQTSRNRVDCFLIVSVSAQEVLASKLSEPAASQPYSSSSSSQLVLPRFDCQKNVLVPLSHWMFSLVTVHEIWGQPSRAIPKAQVLPCLAFGS